MATPVALGGRGRLWHARGVMKRATAAFFALVWLPAAACGGGGAAAPPTPTPDSAVVPDDTGGVGPTDATDADGGVVADDVAPDSASPADAAADAGASGPAVCAGGYGEPVALGALDTGVVAEASGLAVSRLTPGVVWTHNDSGDGPVLYALGAAGTLRATATVRGVAAVDWEDLAAARCPGGAGACLWVADVGDNLRRRSDSAVLVVREPRLAEPATPGAPEVLELDLAWRFPVSWPEKRRDSEALLVAPEGDRFWLIAKADEATAGVYGHPGPLTSAASAVLEHVVDLPSPGLTIPKGRMVTGADLHPTGSRLLVRTYTGVFEYRLDGPLHLSELATLEPVVVVWGPLTEPQGEAVSYDAAGTGVLTLSEDPRGEGHQPLHHYPCLP